MSKLKDHERLFNGRHFDREVIVLCVRWYLRYKLSLRDLVEMMTERGLSLSHTTIMRWVKRFNHNTSRIIGWVIASRDGTTMSGAQSRIRNSVG